MDLRPLVSQILDNMERLDKCRGGHSFGAMPGNDQRMVCSKCQGTVGKLEGLWYYRGWSDGISQAMEMVDG